MRTRLTTVILAAWLATTGNLEAQDPGEAEPAKWNRLTLWYTQPGQSYVLETIGDSDVKG